MVKLLVTNIPLNTLAKTTVSGPQPTTNWTKKAAPKNPMLTKDAISTWIFSKAERSINRMAPATDDEKREDGQKIMHSSYPALILMVVVSRSRDCCFGNLALGHCEDFCNLLVEPPVRFSLIKVWGNIPMAIISNITGRKVSASVTLRSWNSMVRSLVFSKKTL